MNVQCNKKSFLAKKKQLLSCFRLAKLQFQLLYRGFRQKSGITRNTSSAVISFGVFTAISNLIYLPLVTTALFVIYMGHYHFFSYDLFMDGVFGMKLFVLTVFLILFVCSLSLFGLIFMIVANRNKPNLFSKNHLGAMSLFNLGCIVLLVALALEEASRDKLGVIIFVCFFAFYLSVHLGSFIFTKKIKTKFYLFALLFIISFGAIVYLPSYAITVLEIGLRGFGVGGRMPIEIISDGVSIDGELILLSPSNIYFRKNETSKVTYQSLDKITSFEFKNK